MCSKCPASPPQVTAWADQVKAEIRDEAVGMYSTALAAAGIRVEVTEEQLQEISTLFLLGADATLVVLARHGALKRADR